MTNPMTRRALLAGAGMTLTFAWEETFMSAPEAGAAGLAPEPFRYCLNTATLRGQKLPIAEVVDIAAEAGYQGIEPWIDELERHAAQGGSLRDLGKRIQDKNLTVESAIGFAEWIVDDEARRAKGLEVAKRDMDRVAQIGGARIAAPPVGLTDVTDLDVVKFAARYHALCEIGVQLGVTPMVEVWGFSKTLNRLGLAAAVAIESGHTNASVLADVYHLYRGGSDPAGLRLLGSKALPVLHINDYPAIPREQITDAHRVYPGDGIAPMDQILHDLYQIGFRGALSLELFNPDYYKQDPRLVAKTGLQKTKAAVRRALVAK
jgi:sugar phosphate isomerase/epimerase